MPKYEITETNIEVERLLEKTQNPRHRFLLMNFARHRPWRSRGGTRSFSVPT